MNKYRGNDSLYNIPIESLGLINENLKKLTDKDITTVGHCLDIIEMWHTSLLEDGYYHVLGDFLFTELLPKLKQQGYLENSKWSLDGILIEELDLTQQTIQLLRQAGIMNLHDCIEFFEINPINSTGVTPHIISTMFEDVLPKLKKKGYLK